MYTIASFTFTTLFALSAPNSGIASFVFAVPAEYSFAILGLPASSRITFPFSSKSINSTLTFCTPLSPSSAFRPSPSLSLSPSSISKSSYTLPEINL